MDSFLLLVKLKDAVDGIAFFESVRDLLECFLLGLIGNEEWDIFVFESLWDFILSIIELLNL